MYGGGGADVKCDKSHYQVAFDKYKQGAVNVMLNEFQRLKEFNFGEVQRKLLPLMKIWLSPSVQF